LVGLGHGEVALQRLDVPRRFKRALLSALVSHFGASQLAAQVLVFSLQLRYFLAGRTPQRFELNFQNGLRPPAGLGASKGRPKLVIF